jgi:hypothetical protein
MAGNYKALLIVTIAGAIAVSGATAASAASPGTVRSLASGTEHFHYMTTSATSSKASIIATGVFTGGGVDTSGKTADTVTFPRGTFKINHPGATHGKQTLNPRTCLFTDSETGSYTLGGGTGAYAGISGHGTAVITILAVTARNSAGKCSMTLPPAAWQQVINASGPVHL